ncbi:MULTISPECIES: hypothetical protein [Clostridia]|uniref:hypothetical protein n=1 Tax=Clostridia TaxID=186801 RepID=UPI001FAA4CCD|nr:MULTISPECIES: hypothetical protein [Clostridia]
MKKLLSVLLFTILSIIVGASILSTENKNQSTNIEISQMSNAHLLSETGTLLEYHPDKNEAIVQIDNSDKRFLYDKIILILNGPTSQYKIDSSMIGEKIKFSYFNSTPTDKPTLDIYLIDKVEY